MLLLRKDGGGGAEARADYADPTDGSTALIWASQNGHAKIVRALLTAYAHDGGMDVNHARDDTQARELPAAAPCALMLPLHRRKTPHYR